MGRAALLIALAVGGCASAGHTAPISYGGGGADAGPPVSSPVPAPPTSSRAPITYARDEQRQVSPSRPTAPIQDATPAAAPPADPNWSDGAGTPLSTYALQPSDVQAGDPLHTPRTHRVGANESLYDIATRYQIPLRALIDQNHLEPPYTLAPGRIIELPPPNVHVVGNGEAFEDIARDYNIDLRSLALLNRMQPPYVVRPGDRVVLPAMARADVEAAPPAPSIASEAPVEQASAPAIHAGRFAWPLRGAVIAQFGAQGGGGRLDGIEIAGREGAAVTAAADGEVVYAGSDLPAYGTIVLVRHADDLVTAYAYTRRATVHEGDRVRAGQTIAELGSRTTGRTALLFQVRRGSTPIDPTPMLGN